MRKNRETATSTAMPVLVPRPDGRGALLSGGKPGNRGGIGRPTLAVGASSRELYGDVLARIQQKLQEDEPTFSELAQIAAVTGRYGGVADETKDGKLVVTIVRTNAPPPQH